MNAVIIGGGIIGSSIALELATNGLSVTIVERIAIGAEASTAAAGMLAPQLEATGPGPMLNLMLRSRGLYPTWVKKLEAASGVDVGYRPSGALQVGYDEVQVHGLDAAVAWQNASGLRAALLTGDEARRLEPLLAPSVRAAAHFPDDHVVDPRKVMAALRLALSGAGVRVVIGDVQRVLLTDGRASGIALADSSMEAQVVVVAAGAWSGLLKGSGLHADGIRPARGQIVELATPHDLPAHIIKGPTGYLVARPDGRALLGSTTEFVGFEKAVTESALSELLRQAIEAVPSLASARVVGQWSGLRPWSARSVPQLGETSVPGLLAATGHFRNGILLAPITAAIVSQLVRGAVPMVDLTPFRVGAPTA